MREDRIHLAPGEEPPRQPARAVVLAAQVRADLAFAVLDLVLVAVAYVAVFVLRFNASVPEPYRGRFPTFLAIAVAVHLASNGAWGLYGRVWRHASVQEARRLLAAGASSAIVLWGLYGLDLDRVPASVIVLGPPIATMLVGAIRFRSRLFAFRRGREHQRLGLRVAVIGSRSAGAAIVREMLDAPLAGFVPVVVLDDDPASHGRSLLGVPVLGGIDRLAEAVDRFQVHQALLAASSPDKDLVRRAATEAESAGVTLRILPGMQERVGDRPSVRDLREVRIEDLLGREQVATDLVAVRRLLHGRRVLITGAGGSIGSEIARQVALCDPGRLVLLDHDETHLHDAAGVLTGPCHQALVDIRDRERLVEIFARHRPQVVFHAAAHKHVPLLEQHPCEAVTTNAMGTLNVVHAAVQAGTERFVFISSDKAVRPSSVMGASKWVGEQVVLDRAPPGGSYCTVRFGNVLGSRGSVIPTFKRQIASGGPVTVTDPQMTRFFMSVEEAVQLVLQSTVFAKGGEIFMLEMGEAVNILELAKRMIRLSGHNLGTEIAIRITGARPGEKAVEELRAPDEEVEATPHPSIVRLTPVTMPANLLAEGLATLQGLAARREDAAAAKLLLALSHSAARTVEDGDNSIRLDLTAPERRMPWSRSTI